MPTTEIIHPVMNTVRMTVQKKLGQTALVGAQISSKMQDLANNTIQKT